MSKAAKKVVAVVAAVAVPFVAPAIAGSIGLTSALASTGMAATTATTVGSALTGAVLGGTASRIGGGDFGSAAEFATATGGLQISGFLEDGWRGLDFAINNYTFNNNAAKNMILVTDEDRDNTIGLGYADVLASLTRNKALLNAVVNASFRCGDQSVALGIDSQGTGYKADGSGGFTTCAGAFAFSGAGSTIADYVNLALDTGGAAWDLNQLRAGGLTAQSFTAAFVDIKVQEIVTNNAPEPSILALLGLGLFGIGFAKRRRNT